MLLNGLLLSIDAAPHCHRCALCRTANSVEEMKLSLLKDAVHGMYYIHSLGHLHRCVCAEPVKSCSLA